MARGLKHVDSEPDVGPTRRTGFGGIIIVAPTTGPKTYQGPGDLDEPFAGGGRQADLPGGYDQRACADADWAAQLQRNRRQDAEAIGQMHGDLDGTPWLGTGKGHKAP